MSHLIGLEDLNSIEEQALQPTPSEMAWRQANSLCLNNGTNQSLTLPLIVGSKARQTSRILSALRRTRAKGT